MFIILFIVYYTPTPYCLSYLCEIFYYTSIPTDNLKGWNSLATSNATSNP